MLQIFYVDRFCLCVLSVCLSSLVCVVGVVWCLGYMGIFV